MIEKKLINCFVFLFYLSLLNSCSPDVLVPCENDGLKIGLLCKQYIYQGDEVVGYYNYYYNSQNQLVKKALQKSSGIVVREETYQYNTKNQISELNKHDQNSNVDSTFKFSYNTFDSLSEKEIYVSNELITYTTYSYNNYNQIASSINHLGDSILSFTNYNYLSDGKTYKITSYSADTNITAYTLYDYYTNNMLKIEFYKGTTLSDYHILEYENDTLIKLSEFSADQSLNGYYQYEYDKYNNISKISFYDESDDLIYYNEYKYYY